MEENFKMEIGRVLHKLEPIQEKLEDLTKMSNDKKAILNIPVSFDDPKKKGKMDEDFVIEALEKMRDYIASENKRINDQFFKFHLDFESKIREKIDKKELEEIESKFERLSLIFYRENDGERWITTQ